MNGLIETGKNFLSHSLFFQAINRVCFELRMQSTHTGIWKFLQYILVLNEDGKR